MPVKVAIYTAVFGSKDEVREPIGYQENESIDYFLITDDRELTSNHYNIIYKQPVYDDITKNARYYKIKGLEAFNIYDYVIWHDANLQIIQDQILNILQFVDAKGIAFFKHSQRNCVYDEAVKCIQLEKDYPFKILRQLFGYYLNGLKPNDGLYDTSIVIKNNRLLPHELLSFWWNEIKTKSRRDQLSLPYAVRKFGVEPGIIEGQREKNNYTFFSKHKHSSYNFISLQKPKPYSKWHKSIAIKILLFLKKSQIHGI